MKTLYSLILTLFVTAQLTVAQQANTAKPGEVIHTGPVEDLTWRNVVGCCFLYRREAGNDAVYTLIGRRAGTRVIEQDIAHGHHQSCNGIELVNILVRRRYDIEWVEDRDQPQQNQAATRSAEIPF